MLLLLSANFFQNELFQKNFLETLFSNEVSNDLEPDQGRHSVGPDLDPNFLQRFNISRRQKGKS